MAAPPSQKYRSIGFYLESPLAPPAQFIFALRPEELTVQQPSRLTPQQTLGGAWIDSFGPGLPIINLSGHNGWRGGLLESGEDLFQALRTTVYDGWHQQRQAALQAGLDPSTVTLIFTDSLDSIACVVAPRSFTLRRSRTRPLLMMYQIQLVCTGGAESPTSVLDQITQALSNPLRWLAGVSGLGDVLTTVDAAYQTAVNAVGGVGAALGTFLHTWSGLVSSVQSTAESLQGTFDASTSAILSTTTQVSRAGANAVVALADPATLAPSDLIAVMQLGSALNDAACTMSNSFTFDGVYPDYAALFGAGTCSSTGGGDPPSQFTLIGGNPFDSIFAAAAPAPVTVSAAAQAAIQQLSGDPIPLIGQTDTISAALSTIGNGITVAPA